LKAGLRRLYDWSIFVRFTAFGFSLVLPLLGAATVSARLTIAQIIGLIGVATTLHIFGHVLNDVVDLPIDRTEPRRADYPLVRRAILPWQALCFAFAQIPIMFGFAASIGGGLLPYATLLVALVCTVIYDVWGKRGPFPIATDAILGFTFALFVLYGTLAVAGRPNILTGLVMAFEMVFILMVNAIHGGLRDLENDQKHNAKTTATLLGARMHEGVPQISPRLARYGTVLQIVLAALATGAAARNDLGYGMVMWLVTLLVVAGLSVTSIFLLRLALVALNNRGNVIAIGTLHLMVSFIPLLLVFLPHADHRLVLLIASIYVVPLLAHEWLYEAVRWIVNGRVLQRVLDWVQIVRLQNCLAAVLTTLLGAYLAGGRGLLRSRTVLDVCTILCLVVAASNVVNDYRDVVVDSINYPHRPIPSGRVSPRSAVVTAIALAVSAGVGAYRLGPFWGVLVAVFLALGIGYSYCFKNTLLLGNAVIALLCGGLVIAGALAAGGLAPAALRVGCLVFIFMFAYEVLNSVQDQEGDAKAGINTVATRLSRSAALGLFKILALLFVLLALAPWFLNLASDWYLYVLLPCSILPTLAVIANLSLRPSDQSIRVSRMALKCVWFTSLLPMLMMN
jgi:4-hydroxybenzoate polyprenyltransferase